MTTNLPLYRVKAVTAQSKKWSRHGAAFVNGGVFVESTEWCDFRDIPIYISCDQMREAHPDCDVVVELNAVAKSWG